MPLSEQRTRAAWGGRAFFFYFRAYIDVVFNYISYLVQDARAIRYHASTFQPYHYFVVPVFKKEKKGKEGKGKRRKKK